MLKRIGQEFLDAAPAVAVGVGMAIGAMASCLALAWLAVTMGISGRVMGIIAFVCGAMILRPIFHWLMRKIT